MSRPWWSGLTLTDWRNHAGSVGWNSPKTCKHSSRRGCCRRALGCVRRIGDFSEIGLGDLVVTVRTGKRMDDLAARLWTPGREVHCLELMDSVVEERGTGEVIDATARRAYEQRVRDLQRDLDEAEDDNDRDGPSGRGPSSTPSSTS
jgi:hypothetical protein